MAIPFGFAADRVPRLPIVIGGAIAFGVFSMLTGLATTIWVLVIARAGASFGTAVSNPTHNSLLADYYDIPTSDRRCTRCTGPRSRSARASARSSPGC